MSQYRDELEAAQHRIATLEAQVAERDASLKAREAEISEQRSEIERIRGNREASGKAGGQTSGRSPWALLLLSLLLGAAALVLTAGLIQGNLDSRAQQRFSQELSEEVDALSEQIERKEGENRKLRELVERLRKDRDGQGPVTCTDPADCTGFSTRQGVIPAEAGFLSIQSTPSAKVLLDGKPIGDTPLAQVRATPGSHVLKFIYSDLESQTVQVTVEEGKTQTIHTRSSRRPAPSSGIKLDMR
jgi:hypothetical protein